MEPVDLDLATLVTLTGPGIAQVMVERLAAAGFDGVKPSHGYVVQALVEHEPTIGALAASLGMTQQGASKQVADLASLGYVERVVAPGDQRARTVRLTARGRGLLDAARRLRAELDAEVEREVGHADVATTRRVLAVVLEQVGLGDGVRRRRVPLPRS